MSKRILVVEDQMDNRQILRDLLTSVGFNLVEAEDGAQGVAAAETPQIEGEKSFDRTSQDAG